MTTTHLRNTGLLVLAIAIFAYTCPAAQKGRASRTPPRPGAAIPRMRVPRIQLSEHILPAQFQATVIELQGPAERLAGLDPKVLADRAATPEALLSVLGQAGQARVLYRVDQPVNVFSTTSMVGSSEPVITGTQMNLKTNAINRITYQNVGFIIRMSAPALSKADTNTAPTVSLAMQLSLLWPGETGTEPGQKQMGTRSVSLNSSERLAMNQPRVLLAISSNVLSRVQASSKASGNAEPTVAPVAYVVRYTFAPAFQTGSASAAGNRETAPATAEPAQATNSLPARFQATVYDVQASVSIPLSLSARSLESAGTPELVLKALGGFGKAKVLYRVDQPVDVFADQVLLMTNTPVATGARANRTGAPIRSVTYRNEGLRFGFSALAPDQSTGRQAPNVTISFNMSADTPSATELRSGQPASGLATISQEHNEPLEMGRARFMLAAGSTSPGAEGRPFLYVVRYQFDPAPSK
jgi:hypothetical protein